MCHVTADDRTKAIPEVLLINLPRASRDGQGHAPSARPFGLLRDDKNTCRRVLARCGRPPKECPLFRAARSQVGARLWAVEPADQEAMPRQRRLEILWAGGERQTQLGCAR
jgi:hypothetical protein